ncbi:cobyric acid synthase [Oceanobacillus senegalensis]|uniref:cobyric acid synthase n=1 Tax=Oceanobacillus senegalensis TaxID=1936063 RepID=UPI000A30BF22|nr:cobyric acid synthase [Oceanobacillus senegalensis]
MKGIMIQGTGSDVGKSLIATAFCRLFANEGLKVTPFKSQNMSNNSYVTVDGKEIGRAQGVQAEAAGMEANVWMNPILLKPRSDIQSEVVLLGEAVETFSGKDYRERFYDKGLEVIRTSLHYIKENFDVVVIEGAGSPVEINLNDRELVNMKVAELADVPVVLVADIERGGVFASIIGTLELLAMEERNRIKGLIINKFRGDIQLFQDGVNWLEENTGIPVFGVLPHIDNHQIDEEDSLSLQAEPYQRGNREIDIAVIHFPYISNYSDVEPFFYEEDVAVRFVKDPSEFGKPDAVILPDTKSTIQDLQMIKNNGFEKLLVKYVQDGGFIFGISGGYQMMGTEITDEFGGDTGIIGCNIKGLNLIPARTFFRDATETVRSNGHYHLRTSLKGNTTITGYEIHLGRTEVNAEYKSFLMLDDGKSEGYYGENGRVIGTYVHHLFHSDEWRNQWLNHIRNNKSLPSKSVVNTEELKKERYDRLANNMKEHLDWEKIKDMVNSWESEK